MGQFFEITSNITKNIIEGFAAFWNWFINPLFTIDFRAWLPDTEVITIAPWMIFSFATLMLIFAISLWHLLNPLG